MEVSQGRAAHLQTEREWERKELKRERGGGWGGGRREEQQRDRRRRGAQSPNTEKL